MSEQEEENAAELKIGEEFLKAKCLMNCKVALILDRKFDQLQAIVFEKSQQYVKRFSRYKNADALCVLGNLCPETADEAKAMVPSIMTKERGCTDENIEKMLGDLSLIKKFE
ncbi:hypothetical protein MKX01_017749 [Papaver californicum]|nr:hypothetical protein MKX01_017749 [Papaver californicum]